MLSQSVVTSHKLKKIFDEKKLVILIADVFGSIWKVLIIWLSILSVEQKVINRNQLIGDFKVPSVLCNTYQNC